MPNGLETERMLFEGLEKRGFRFAPPSSDRNDKVFKIDRVVIAPPGIEGACFFPMPIGVQLTLRHGDWAKRAEFLEKARLACARLAYVELTGEAIEEEFFNAVAAALTALFFDERAPKEALVAVCANRYRLGDLATEMERYRAWLAVPIVGELVGQVIHWRAPDRYGFISAPVPGPDGIVESATFFFHQSAVSDAELTDRLSKSAGDLAGTSRIPVIFNDAGQAAPEHWRKAAIEVALRKP